MTYQGQLIKDMEEVVHKAADLMPSIKLLSIIKFKKNSPIQKEVSDLTDLVLRVEEAINLKGNSEGT